MNFFHLFFLSICSFQLITAAHTTNLIEPQNDIEESLLFRNTYLRRPIDRENRQLEYAVDSLNIADFQQTIATESQIDAPYVKSSNWHRKHDTALGFTLEKLKNFQGLSHPEVLQRIELLLLSRNSSTESITGGQSRFDAFVNNYPDLKQVIQKKYMQEVEEVIGVTTLAKIIAEYCDTEPIQNN